MSDAMNDVLTDRVRTRKIIEYRKALLAYLDGNLPKREAMKRAKAASGGPYGFFTDPVDLVTGLEKDLVGLKIGRMTTWAKLIFWSWEDYYMLARLYSLSPWKDRTIMVRLDYEQKFLQILKVFPEEKEVSLERAEKIIRSRDWIVNDGDKYLITISDNGITNAYWIGNTTGFQCKDGAHRQLKKPRKSKEWIDGGTIEQREKFCC